MVLHLPNRYTYCYTPKRISLANHRYVEAFGMFGKYYFENRNEE